MDSKSVADAAALKTMAQLSTPNVLSHPGRRSMSLISTFLENNGAGMLIAQQLSFYAWLACKGEADKR
jgi:hypothetical protein